MANRYQTFREDDLGAGIDQQSAENRIPPGYAENITNMDPISTGQIKTRVGYQGYCGYLPVRVKRVEYSDDATDNLCFYLDGTVDLTSVDLTGLASTPLIIQGKTSSANVNNAGDFPNDQEAIKYYPGFTTDFKKTLVQGTNTLVIPQDEHTFNSEFLFVGISESTSQINTNNSQFTVDSISIDKITKDISIDYTNGTGADIEVFVYILNKAAVSGSSFVSSPTVIATGTATYTVTSGTHGLNTFNILPAIFEDTAGDLIQLIPDALRILPNGNVEIDITNGTGSPFNAVFILSSAGASNVVTGSVAANDSASITISNLQTDFLFVAPYLEVTIGGNFEYVLPDSITIDSVNQTATITFVNNDSTGKNFELYYEYANIAANKLCVDASVIGALDVYTDNRPQITIYGLPHSELYGSNRQPRQGWANHIDSYRSTGEDRLISGLGGNIFSAQLASEGSNQTDLLMAELYPNIRGRVAADTVIGPVFIDTTDTSSRTRGYIQATDAGSNFLRISSASYQTGSGYTRYRLEAPGLVINGTLSTIISTTIGTEDELVVEQMGYARLNGTFKIRAVTAGADYLDIDVENDAVDSTDFNETDTAGFGGVFTDRLTLTSTSLFQAQDMLESELFESFTVIANSGSMVLFSGVDSELGIPGGLRIVGSRETSVVPLRLLDGTPSIENLVRGDMLTYQGINRQVRVKYLNPNSDISLTSIEGDGSFATATLGSGDMSGYTVGQQVLIRGSASYNGVQTISEITSTTTFTFASTELTSESGTLVGKTVNIDETMLIADATDSSNVFSVYGRWIPVEAPEDSFNLTPSTYVRYFDATGYTDQPILRSVMVQDNLYFTNGQDEVMKFDGANIYRAGLFRWQPHLFVSTDTTASGVIVLENPSIAYTASSANRFTVTQEDRLTFPIGTKIEDSVDGEKYLVVDTLDDGTNAQIIVNREIQSTFGGTPTLTKVSTFKYYFRLNSIDPNNNIIASAVVGADDFVVEMAEDAGIRLRLVGMPVIDNYDFSRLEVQIYRTKSDQTGPYYRISTIPMDFDSDNGYIDYLDTDSDEDLIDLDEVNTALFGAELGTGIEGPVRSKYCTSADNKLILSNIIDYPTIDLTIIQNSTGPITISDLIAAGNNRWLFRKDNTDPATTTDMINRAAYQFVGTGSAVTISPSTDITSPSTDVVNVNETGHGLAVGNWIYLYHSVVADGNLLTFSGWHQISAVPDVDNFQFNYQGAVAGTANDVDRYVTATLPADVPVLLGLDGNYSMLNGNRLSTEPYEFLAMRRMANALNASMRKVDTSITGYEDFAPWMIGNAGNEFNVGQLIVKQPVVIQTNLEIQLPALTGVFDTFVNGVRRVASASGGALERSFPSRSLISFPNFPELFDKVAIEVDINSESAVDVNSADGQEITATIPFFGDSAFGGAMKSGVVVIFKENSIYLLDTGAKFADQAPVQKLESQGKGCTAPFSVALTRDGIMFANFSGIYRLDRALQIQYIGRKYQRIWLEQVNRDQLELATGHNFSVGNQYKLSIPVGNASQLENNNVAVYNHTREYEGQGPGSWTTYDSHPATGWANLLDDAYFCTTDGQVFSIRRANDNTDYRDDASAISWNVLLRAMDFGDGAIRKVFGWVVSHYRTLVETSSVALNSGVNLAEELEDTDPFTIQKDASEDGLSDLIQQKIVSLRSSLKTRLGNYLQLEYLGSGYDQPVEIAGVDIQVSGMSVKGVTEARETSGTTG